MARRVTIKSYRKTITAATAQPLFTNAEAALGHSPTTVNFFVRSLGTNAGNVFLGDVDVTTNYDSLVPGGGVDYAVLPMSGEEYIHYGMSDIYYLGTIGDIIVVTYLAFVN